MRSERTLMVVTERVSKGAVVWTGRTSPEGDVPGAEGTGRRDIGAEAAEEPWLAPKARFGRSVARV